MKLNNIFVIFAIVAIVIAIANISVTLIKVSDIKEGVTGYVTETGVVNISIVEVLIINMTNATINWGHGRVNTGEANATLYTVQDGTASVTRGNWSNTNVAALRLDNIGNVNVSLTLQTAMTAYGFFGSSAGNPVNEFNNSNEEYKWNITEVYANSCNGGNFSAVEGLWVNVNQSAAETICGDFNYASSANALYIDIWLTVPADATNTSVAGIVDTITAIGSST